MASLHLSKAASKKKDYVLVLKFAEQVQPLLSEIFHLMQAFFCLLPCAHADSAPRVHLRSRAHPGGQHVTAIRTQQDERARLALFAAESGRQWSGNRPAARV